jgi:hypothetical protein
MAASHALESTTELQNTTCRWRVKGRTNVPGDSVEETWRTQ